MKTLMRTAFAAALAFAAHAHPAAMNLTFSAAYRYGASCTYTLHGGARNQGGTPSFCWLEIPLPIEAGRTLKQITVFHGTDGAGLSSIDAYLAYKELRPSQVADASGWNHLADWSSTSAIAGGAMSSGELMTEIGSPPLVSYPDAFTLAPDRAYYVRVTIGQQAEFFGLRVLYD